MCCLTTGPKAMGPTDYGLCPKTPELEEWLKRQRTCFISTEAEFKPQPYQNKNTTANQNKPFLLLS
jgi:hypothetical protein